MARSFESKTSRVLERSDSIRTVVPAPVAALLGVEPGDVLVWTVEPGSGRVTVSRQESDASAVKRSARR